MIGVEQNLWITLYLVPEIPLSIIIDRTIYFMYELYIVFYTSIWLMIASRYSLLLMHWNWPTIIKVGCILNVSNG